MPAQNTITHTEADETPDERAQRPRATHRQSDGELHGAPPILRHARACRRDGTMMKHQLKPDSPKEKCEERDRTVGIASLTYLQDRGEVAWIELQTCTMGTYRVSPAGAVREIAP